MWYLMDLSTPWSHLQCIEGWLGRRGLTRALPLEHLWGTRVLVHFEHDVAVTFLLENRFGRCLAHAAENNISRSGSGEIFAWSGCVGARHIFNSQSRCATSIAWLGAFLQAPQCVGMQQLCCNTAVSLLLLLFLITPVLLLQPLPPPAFSAPPTSACTPAWPSCGASQPPRRGHPHHDLASCITPLCVMRT